VLEVLLGTAKCGAVALPVNWRLAAPEIAYIVDHAEAPVLVVGPEFVETVAASRPSCPGAHDPAARPGRPVPGVRGLVGEQPATDPGHQPRPDDVVVQMVHLGHHRAAEGRAADQRQRARRMAEMCEFWRYDAEA